MGWRKGTFDVRITTPRVYLSSERQQVASRVALEGGTSARRRQRDGGKQPEIAQRGSGRVCGRAELNQRESVERSSRQQRSSQQRSSQLRTLTADSEHRATHTHTGSTIHWNTGSRFLPSRSNQSSPRRGLHCAREVLNQPPEVLTLSLRTFGEGRTSPDERSSWSYEAQSKNELACRVRRP